jgi:hypothetical protein
MREYFNTICILAMLKVQGFLKEEKGDTNFISILIILGIVIALAGVFMGFKNQIVTQVQEIVAGFTIG